MSRPPIDLDRIRAYLLGSAPTDDSDVIESAYFQSADFLASVANAEEDLIEDYLAGRLDGEMRGAFETRYLASSEHRRRVALARELMNRARTRRASSSLLPLAVAAAILVAAVLGVVLLRRQGPVQEARGGAAAGSGTAGATGAPGGSAPVGATVAILLPAEIVRGEGETATVRAPAGVGSIALQLERGGSEGEAPYHVTIRTVEGSDVWKGDAAAPGAQEPDGPTVIAVATVPTASLPPGDYVVVLSGGAPEPSEIQRYFFRVLTP